MNKKQTIIAWVGAAFFVFCVWNPKVHNIDSRPGRYLYRSVFDDSFTALFGRLSSTVVLTGLAVYTFKNKPKDKEKEGTDE